jgi:hypothetical protein
MIKTVLGLRHQRADTNEAEVSLKPYFFEELTHAEGSYRTRGGEVSIAWHRLDGRIVMKVTVTGEISVDYEGKRLSVGDHEFSIGRTV